MTRTETYNLTNGMVNWTDISRHPNQKACKPWVARVDGYDPESKYDWEQEFLELSTIDGDPHASLSKVSEGDVIRVSGASHNNDKTQCWLVNELTEDELVVERLSDEEAIEQVQSVDDAAELRRRIKDNLPDADRDALEEAVEILS